MTGCGCLLLVALLAVLLYVFTFGSTDAGEPIEQAVALKVAALSFSALGFAAAFSRGRYAPAAIAGRRAAQSVARS